MRWLLLGALLVLLGVPTAAHATTTNETALYDHLTLGTWTNSAAYATPIYKVCGTAPEMRFARDSFGGRKFVEESWTDCDTSNQISVLHVGWDNTGMAGDQSYREPALSAEWKNIPTPAGFKASAGTDKAAVVEDFSRDQYIEFWGLREVCHYTDGTESPGTTPTPGKTVTTQTVSGVVTQECGWLSAWGGSMPYSQIETGPDGLRMWPALDPPSVPHEYGTSASGIALGYDSILLADLQRGVADHPIGFTVLNAPTATKYPATRNPGDGRAWSSPLPVQYGAMFNLPAGVDVDSYTSDSRWCAPSSGRTSTEATAAGWDSVNLRCPFPPVLKTILKTAQDRYIVPTDQHSGTPGVSFYTEGYDRPRVDSWASVPAGNPFSEYFGCDGYNNTGKWTSTFGGFTWNTNNGVPVGGDDGPDGIHGNGDDRHIVGDWEQDCSADQGSAWKGSLAVFNQLTEIP